MPILLLRSLLYYSFLTFVAGVLFSCHKDSASTPTAAMPVEVQDYLSFAGESDNFLFYLEPFITPNSSAHPTDGCATLISADPAYQDTTTGDLSQHKVVLGFGANCKDSKTRSGTLTYRWQGPYSLAKNPRRLISVSSSDYALGDIRFVALTKTYTATSGITLLQGPSLLINGNYSIAYPTSQLPTIFSESAQLIWAGGYSYAGNIFEPNADISAWRWAQLGTQDVSQGTALTGQGRNGISFTAVYSLSDTLYTTGGCLYPRVRGTVNLRRGGKGDVQLNYNTAQGACSATVQLSAGSGSQLLSK